MQDNFKYFPSSWYPICLSHEILKDEIREIELFNTKLILYRTKDSSVGLTYPYCPHMGTSFKGGSVSENRIICPLHQREYDCDGVCTKIPGTDKKLDNIDATSFKVHEEMGIVFAFLGKEKTFDFPEFPRAKNEKIYSSCANYTLNTPYQSLIFNGFDTHHLGCIHNRTLDGDSKFEKINEFHFIAEYVMKVIPGKAYDYIVKLLNADRNDIHLDCYGGNFLIITNHGTKDNILITSVPITYKKSRIFLCSITEKSNLNFFQKITTKLRLMVTTYLGVSFLKPDIEIIDDMKPDIRNFFLEQDKGAIDFWRFYDEIPRDKEFQDKINS